MVSHTCMDTVAAFEQANYTKIGTYFTALILRVCDIDVWNTCKYNMHHHHHLRPMNGTDCCGIMCTMHTAQIRCDPYFFHSNTFSVISVVWFYGVFESMNRNIACNDFNIQVYRITFDLKFIDE